MVAVMSTPGVTWQVQVFAPASVTATTLETDSPAQARWQKWATEKNSGFRVSNNHEYTFHRVVSLQEIQKRKLRDFYMALIVSHTPLCHHTQEIKILTVSLNFSFRLRIFIWRVEARSLCLSPPSARSAQRDKTGWASHFLIQSHDSAKKKNSSFMNSKRS